MYFILLHIAYIGKFYYVNSYLIQISIHIIGESRYYFFIKKSLNGDDLLITMDK